MHRPDTAIRTDDDVETQTVDLETPPADLPEPRLTDNAHTVLAKRYLKKNEDLEPIETEARFFEQADSDSDVLLCTAEDLHPFVG